MVKEWTGERLETNVFNENTTEHLHRYAVACRLAERKKVLDIACGEGYGSKLISLVAEKVTGVDIDEAVVIAAGKKYKASNLIFLSGSAAAIPVEDNSIDLVVSFETLEHHDQHEQMFAEIKRVLKKDGVLLMSSPDKKYYTDIPGNHNPHHVKELYFEEFKELVGNNFVNKEFFTQKMITGSLILPEQKAGSFEMFSGNYESVEDVNTFHGVYNICLASDGALPKMQSSFFNGEEIGKKLAAAALQAVRNSWRYRLGDMLLKPLKLFRK